MRIVKFLMFKDRCAQLSMYINYTCSYAIIISAIIFDIWIYDIQSTGDNSKSKFRYINIQKIGILKKINLNKIIDEKDKY